MEDPTDRAMLFGFSAKGLCPAHFGPRPSMLFPRLTPAAFTDAEFERLEGAIFDAQFSPEWFLPILLQERRALGRKLRISVVKSTDRKR
jgi:hypothetical protein